MPVVIANPILNSPFREPTRHFQFDDEGITDRIADGRRPSGYFLPIASPRKKGGQLKFETEWTRDRFLPSPRINRIRERVGMWRQGGYVDVTATTARLLAHWNDVARDRPLFFCQIEALETAIYIAEVARKYGDVWIENDLRDENASFNGGLPRLALKMATGSGKTVVMAMLIAWQALNKLQDRHDARFSDTFLIVTPGITIRDRLRVLLPTDPDNYYRQRDILPADLAERLGQARILITNYHAFLPRERGDASRLTKALLAKGEATTGRRLPEEVEDRSGLQVRARAHADAKPERRCHLLSLLRVSEQSWRADRHRHLQQVPRRGSRLMATNSPIEWTEATWNPVTGCDKVSPGCAHCYAERMAKRLKGMKQPNYARGFEVTLQPQMLDLPLRWKRGRRVFVNSMSDLFHAEVPTAYVRSVFDVMNRATWHQYQILTKRSERLLALSDTLPWSSHIWMGVSVENRKFVDRIARLRATAAKVKFLSLEPLLGPLQDLDLSGIDWVIVGGESGPGARPMDPSWVIDIRDQCRDAGVAFFFKQWGGVFKSKTGRELDGATWDEMPLSLHSSSSVASVKSADDPSA